MSKQRCTEFVQSWKKKERGIKMVKEISPKRALGNGRWDRKLKERMVALSKADDYDEAKHEWVATGEVWWEGVGAMPHWCNTPFKCLCGHDIVYHFEIHNTETDVREAVGSDHINSYLILRAIREETGLSDEFITDEMIEEWIEVRVEALKKTVWWRNNGEHFTEMFDAIKDLDLRVNVREDGKYYDSQFREYRPRTFIRKRAEGEFGKPGYKMASIVWRWNHPDNPKAQANRKGWPNNKLYNDLLMFYYTINDAKDWCEKQDKINTDRLVELKNIDDAAIEKRKKFEERKKMVATVQEIQHLPVFVEACEYYDVKPFVPEEGKDAWEVKFLTDIKKRMVDGNVLTEKQAQKLWDVLRTNKAVTVPATEKQKNYLIRLGYEGDIDEITKAEASVAISEIKQERMK